MKYKVIIVFTLFTVLPFCLFSQTRSEISSTFQKLNNEVQSGYFEYTNQVTNRALHKGENSEALIKFHFIRTGQGNLNYIQISENSVYIRNNGVERYFTKSDGAFKEQTYLNSPINFGNNGILQAWFIDSLIFKITNNDRYKLKTDGQRSVLSYTDGVEGYPNKVSNIEYGFNGIYPDYFRSIIPGKQVSQINVQRLTKMELNHLTESGFDALMNQTLEIVR